MFDDVKDALAALGRGDTQDVEDFLKSLISAQAGEPGKKPLRAWLKDTLVEALEKAEISSGTLGEIGGSKNSFASELTGFDIRYLSLYPSDDPAYITADITDCPQIPDESFDAIISVNVMEHVAKPWLAAKEITRILKPGGLTYHFAPFSYFYHRAPIDCWRYTPEAFEVLFDGFEEIRSEFYTGNRRRDNRGKPPRDIETFGGPGFAIDAYGGWRENIYTIYAATKP